MLGAEECQHQFKGKLFNSLPHTIRLFRFVDFVSVVAAAAAVFGILCAVDIITIFFYQFVGNYHIAVLNFSSSFAFDCRTHQKAQV